ncbi:unnamed protein product [Heligmosomoides polygyrus]|uniref:VWFA domain-containing protein n=1 Tax=Heligmosomoides polygyrus TaxID=6339 RepID=A0A3P8A5I9_HELPZ|nr:unnamed protein product [Heligmosomoides polygyrus]
MDTVRIGLIVTNIVFLILSIVFIILFATKHDSSSGFFLSSSAPGKAADALKTELTNDLQKKFSVGTLAVEKLDDTVSALFSLRGSVKLADVQSALKGTTFASAQVTDGSRAVEVCQSLQPIVVGTTVPAPQHSSTAAPVVTTKYCNGVLKRDVVLLVDTLASPTGDTKKAALVQLGATLADGIPFGSGVRVAVVSLNGGMKIGDFVSDAPSFLIVWNQLTSLPFTDAANSIDVLPAYGVVASLLTQQTPLEAVLISDHPVGAVDAANDIRLKGVFVSAVIPTAIKLPGFDKLTTVRKSYDTWSKMATDNPFSTLFCQYSDAVAVPNAAVFAADKPATDDTPKCQKLDIIVVFDTSQSVVEPFVRKYADFATDFISQYSLSGAVDGDDTRTGIISFSSDVSVVQTLGDRPLSDFKTAVNGIHYTGGTTNTLAAMKAGRDMFKQASGTTHGRAMVFLSDGQPYPMTPETWIDCMNVAGDLKGMGVDIFFVGDDNVYDAETRTVLSNITGNAAWVFNTTADAKIGLTTDLLAEFPCPPMVCEMAYYAVELSEILSDQSKNTSLNFILQTAQNVYNAKNSTQFQLMIYNDQQYLLPNNGDYSFDNFKAVVGQLINNITYRETFSSGHTRIDTAINALAKEMNVQQLRRPFFQSSVLFAGQANSGVLDPIGDEDTQKADLRVAAKNIQAVCPLVYALDDSSGNVQIYGDDLWNLVVPAERTVRISSADLQKDLQSTDYYENVQALDCKLPTQARCDLSFIDLAVAIDLSGKEAANVTEYVNTILSHFNTIYTAHVSMIAYGGGKQAAVLSSLAAYQDMSSGFDNLQKWKNGTFFTTTPVPTTSAAPSTTKSPTAAPEKHSTTKALQDSTSTTNSPTAAPTKHTATAAVDLSTSTTNSPTAAPAKHTVTAAVDLSTSTTKKVAEDNFEVNAAISADDINSLFTLLRSQFGCGSYSDDADRVLVPNVVLVVSDNFASYANVWEGFQKDAKADWDCSDCPANPAYVFLSSTGDVAPLEIGVTYTITDDDYALDGSMKAVTVFNSIVNGLCNTPLRAKWAQESQLTDVRSRVQSEDVKAIEPDVKATTMHQKIRSAACDSAVLENFRRQASLGGLQALGSLSTIVEIVHKVVVFLVDAVHNGIFPKAGERGVEIPVDSRSGTPLLELRGLLSLTRKAEPRAKEAVVRSRVELGDNGDVGQAILAVEDDVVDLVVELATGRFPGPS